MNTDINYDASYMEKSYQQFETHPYPNIPIEDSPKNNIKLLYENSLTTAFYHRDRKVIRDLHNRTILDVACGTGFTTLVLALANPGAKIIGIDISPSSIKIAEQRLEYHGCENVSFSVVALEELSSLGQDFDYINASDILYLLPDLTFALTQLKLVLKENGIIQANLHSQHQRVDYYRAQELFKEMGLMEDNPGDIELSIVREFYEALKDNVDLKFRTWKFSSQEISDQRILMNHLFQNDKGYTLKQLFTAIREADLEFINMVDWRDWNWQSLFKDPDDLPIYISMGLENADLETQLRFYELVQPDKRLLNFWCGHQKLLHEISEDSAMVAWRDSDPEKVIIHLHPCLVSDEFCLAVRDLQDVSPFNLGMFFNFLIKDGWLDRSLTRILFLPLLEAPRSLAFLAERWLQIRPLNPVTLEPTAREQAVALLRAAVLDQEKLGIFLLEAED